MPIETTDPDVVYEAILPLWKATKPSVEAQTIRASIRLPGDLEDTLPDYVWQIADIAAQMAFEKAGVQTTPSILRKGPRA